MQKMQKILKIQVEGKCVLGAPGFVHFSAGKVFQKFHLLKYLSKQCVVHLLQKKGPKLPKLKNQRKNSSPKETRCKLAKWHD